MITIYTFYSQDAPEGLKAIARIRMQMPGKGGVLKMDWLPIVIHAATEDAARVKAQTWWDAEFAKEKARAEHYKIMAKVKKEKAKITKVTVKVEDLIKTSTVTVKSGTPVPFPMVNKVSAPVSGLKLTVPGSTPKLPSIPSSKPVPTIPGKVTPSVPQLTTPKVPSPPVKPVASQLIIPKKN